MSEDLILKTIFYCNRPRTNAFQRRKNVSKSVHKCLSYFADRWKDMPKKDLLFTPELVGTLFSLYDTFKGLFYTYVLLTRLKRGIKTREEKSLRNVLRYLLFRPQLSTL